MTKLLLQPGEKAPNTRKVRVAAGKYQMVCADRATEFSTKYRDELALFQIFTCQQDTFQCEAQSMTSRFECHVGTVKA